MGAPDAQNIGLAIPASRIKSALDSYKLNNKIIRPRIGIFSRSITSLDRKQYNWLPVDYGELIIAPDGSGAIEKGSAADEAGLKEGDIILKLDDQIIKTSNSNPTPLKRFVLGYQKDDTVKLEVLKTTGLKDGVFEYGNDSTEVKLKLGGVSVDLDSNKVIL
ncbi:MAG: PDZ domain-containing protein [Thermales bacterium]|nr:PDZ domain-containing protein [Thermales bacterium]